MHEIELIQFFLSTGFLLLQGSFQLRISQKFLVRFDVEFVTCDDNTCTTLKVYMLRQKPHSF